MKGMGMEEFPAPVEDGERLAEDVEQRILSRIPQKPPFCFVDSILSAGTSHVLGAYRYKESEFFYSGHFPGNPVTPGVILLETMAQIGLVAHAVFRCLEAGVTREETARAATLFTLAEDVAFLGIVRPGERVLVYGENIFFRRQGVRARVSMRRENGEPVCRGVLSGTGVLL
jgi:3-hydroxyacyl-[acyl-carrier-protein] dehydratase